MFACLSVQILIGRSWREIQWLLDLFATTQKPERDEFFFENLAMIFVGYGAIKIYFKCNIFPNEKLQKAILHG